MNFKFIGLTALCLLSCLNLLAQSKAMSDPMLTGVAVLRLMHSKYYEGPCKNYTFSQRNTHYRNDSVIGHSEWHEAVGYPDKFRISFGPQGDGNYVLFRNDSTFNYKSNQLVKKRADTNSLLLLIGGMFYRDFENVTIRLKNAGYNLAVLSEQKWNKEAVYVIGAKEHDGLSNQIWIDKKTLYILRIIEKRSAKDQMDMRFEAHQDWCKGNVETKVSFRRNGKLEQEETYYDLKVVEEFPEHPPGH